MTAVELTELQGLYNELQENDENNSLTKKHLSPYLALKYGKIKTTYGGTLAMCIKHNISNPNALLPRCADAECYSVFNEFFDVVIRDYHKVTTEKIHHPHSSFGDLDDLPFSILNKGKDLIVSTRIRVARTLKGYGFAPVISLEERLALEKEISTVLLSFTGEFEGEYYSLDGMPKEEYDQLVKEHYLFRDDDSVLRDAGGYRDWPSGRGIFINKNKNFLVWVNEEDHMRIISMQNGGNLEEVYIRLAKVLRLLSDYLEFEESDRFGFLTFCPSNLGTTLRASVHASIPMVSSLPNFTVICDSYGLQSRGTFGEHTENVGGIHDLSNKRRLGLDELQAVTEMANGVKEILSLELKIQEYMKMLSANVPPVEPLDYLAEMILNATGSRCLMKQYLRPDIIRNFSGLRTRQGFTLAHMLRNCAYNPNALCPRMGDADCYILFQCILDFVIREYHKLKGGVIKHPPSSFGGAPSKPLEKIDPSGEYVLSTRIRIARNVEGYRFGPHITRESRLALETVIVEALSELKNEHAGKYFSLKNMDKSTRKKLMEDHFLFKDDDSVLRDAGGYRDWPDGRGIFHNKNKTFLCWIGEEDHLRIISMQGGDDLASVYSRLDEGIKAIESRLKFYRNEKYGYLTCCPSNLGTTLRASVHIKIPKLTAKKKRFDFVCNMYGLQARGVNGEHTESQNGVYDLSNKRRLGYTELDAVVEMALGVKEIIKMEKSMKSSDV